MGNQQQQHIDAAQRHIELDRSEAIYCPNDIISGNVLHSKSNNAYLSLTGNIHFKKHKKSGVEYCEIIFFLKKFDLFSSFPVKQNFQFQFDEHLPPSLNNSKIFPNISYSINLVYTGEKDHIAYSLPIHFCPIIKIDQPLLLKPLFFDPVENSNYGTKLQVKVNRSVFIFDDIIQIYYELNNPKEEFIQKIDVSLGVYYLVDSNIHQEDLPTNTDNINTISSRDKLIQHKVLLNIPKKIYLPPTFEYKHEQEEGHPLFDLTIEYKIQFKIYIGQPENLWQVDVPIVLCDQLLGQTDTETLFDTNFEKTE